MSSADLFKLDRYDLNARLKPALLAVLPIFLIAAFWLPEVWTLLGTLAGLAVTCGVALLLSKIARYLGRGIEAKLAARIGPRTTVMSLRHTDTHIDPVTKARYHSALRASGHLVPTALEEANAPDIADAHYSGCASWLLEQTRNTGDFNLLFEENIDYGFRRNLLGLKPIALAILALCLVANLVALVATWNGIGLNFWRGVTLGVMYIALVHAWLRWVTIEFVEDASRAFAKRLLAACDRLPTSAS